MKKLLLLTTFVSLLISCEKSTNYSAQIAAENKRIKEYIKTKGYAISNVFPADSATFVNREQPFFFNVSEDSIYYRLLQKGTGPKVKKNDKIEIRWIESTLDTPPVVENWWSTMDLPYPVELMYGDVPGQSNKTNNNSIGWQDAIGKMGYSGSVAEFIVPPKIGLAKAVDRNSVRGYHYKFTFKVLPK